MTRSQRIKGLLVGSALFLIIWYSPLILSLIKPSLPALLPQSGAQQVKENTLVYPKLGLETPVTINSESDPMMVADWNKIRPALRQGVSAAFTQDTAANAPLIFVIGHSSDYYPHQYSSVFAGLGMSDVGDTLLANLEGNLAEYKVIEKKILSPYDLDSFSSLKPAPGSKNRLALVTCWPLLTTKNRLVVVAEKI